MNQHIITIAVLAMAVSGAETCLADGHHEGGPCAAELEKLTPYWEEAGFGQHGDITGLMRLTQDGRYMVFGSYGNYFVPGVPGTSEGGTRQIYRLDRHSNEFDVITLAWDEAEEEYANGQSGWLLDLSPNGRFVAFTSLATNLIEPDEQYITGEYTHVYVRDLQEGVTYLASVSSDGTPGNNTSGFANIGVSNNGKVAFASQATNLVAHEGATMQVYVHDVKSGQTDLVSVSNQGVPGSFASSSPAIAGDGSLVTFNSPTAFDPALPFNFHNLWGRDLSTGMTEAISVDNNGSDRFGVGTYSKVSADGRFVFFLFDSQNPLDSLMPNYTSLYVRDRVNQTTQGVGTDIKGEPIMHPEFDMHISSDGRYVSFDTWSILTEAETYDQRQVYRIDMQTGEIVHTSIDVTCEAIQEESDAIFPAMSGDASTVIFTTVWDVMQNDDGGKIPHDWAHHVYAWNDPDVQPPAQPGDLNGDGVVDVSDLLILLSAWGECEEEQCDADLNSDGTVDVSDLLILLANWG